MRVAEQFIKQLQEGKTTEAITTLKSSLFESTAEMIEESKQEVISSYGFKVNEAKKNYNEKEEDMDKDKEMDDDESEDDEDDSKDKEEE